MAKKQKNRSDTGRNAAAVRMLIGGIVIAVIAVAFITRRWWIKKERQPVL